MAASKSEHLRQSNWELMRIISMLIIIAGHYCGQSGFLQYASNGEYWFASFFGSGARIAVNMFLLLGVWFMVDAKFRARRVIKLYLNTWIFTVPLTIIALLSSFHPAIKYVVKGFIPFIGLGVWFVSGYLALLLLSPWLQKLLELPERTLRGLVFISFMLVCGWLTFWSFYRTEDMWLDIISWFIFVYLFIGWYKQYGNLSLNKWLILGLGIGCYVLLVTVTAYSQLYEANSYIFKFIAKAGTAFLSDYKTFPNLLIAMCIFYFFQHLSLKTSRVINFLATGSLTAYVFHQTPAFINVLWFGIFRSDVVFSNYSYRILYLPTVVIMTYLLALLLETLRRRFLEEKMLNCRFAKFVEVKIDRFYCNI